MYIFKFDILTLPAEGGSLLFQKVLWLAGHEKTKIIRQGGRQAGRRTQRATTNNYEVLRVRALSMYIPVMYTTGIISANTQQRVSNIVYVHNMI